MLKQKITILVQATVSGPDGIKLMPGKTAILEDSPYVRLLLKSGTVVLVDPPSLDPVFLEKAGYQLRDGYSYPVSPSIIEKPIEKSLNSKKAVKTSDEKADTVSNSSGTLNVTYTNNDGALVEGDPGNYPQEDENPGVIGT